MEYKYGNFSQNQIAAMKRELRKSIFFLLLCVDPETKDEFTKVNIDEAFNSLLYKLAGLNSILLEPVELIEIISLLESAHMYLSNDIFEFKI